MGKCNVQIVLVRTVGIRVMLRYVLLNAEQIVYISFVINAFKKFFHVINACKMFLCIYFLLTIIKFFGGFLIWHWFFKCGVSWSLEAPSDGDLL